METVTYKTQMLTEEYYKIFTGLYNDFKLQAVSNYKFELNPLPYEEFIDAVDAVLSWASAEILLSKYWKLPFITVDDASEPYSILVKAISTPFP